MLVRVHCFRRCDWIFQLTFLNCQGPMFSENTGKFLVLLFFWKRNWRLHWLGFIFFLKVFVESCIRNSHSYKREKKRHLPWPWEYPANNWCQPELGTTWTGGSLLVVTPFCSAGWSEHSQMSLASKTMGFGSNWVTSEECVLFLPPHVLKALQEASEICRRCLVCLWWDKQMTSLCD